MISCARCKNPIVENKSVTLRRKDGSSAILCLNCAKEIKAKQNEKRHAQEVADSFPPETNLDKKTESSSDSDKWYKNIGVGVLCLVMVVFLFVQLTRLESGDVSSVRVWWPVVILYNTFGLYGALACPGILALLFFGIGIKQLANEIE